jgi:hypothetical protein
MRVPIGARRSPTPIDPGLGSSMGFGFEHVDEETAQQLRELADRVRMTLTAAGIPVIGSSPGADGGAVIDVDTGADEAGGIYIAWRLPRAQHDEMISYVAAGQDSLPRLRYLLEVLRAMRDAIMAILNASGLTAARSEDHNDMAPIQVLVGIPGVSHIK